MCFRSKEENQKGDMPYVAFQIQSERHVHINAMKKFKVSLSFNDKMQTC